jgi:predicted GIY-YIG superfamily endonuclease
MWFCYILHNKQDSFLNCTYNGATNNPIRRLRQHNCEISGGAKVTTKRKGGWIYAAILSGFHTHVNCLSCEWRIKCPSGRPGKREPKYNGITGRIKSLNEILPLNKWTGKCVIENNTQTLKLHILKEYEEYINKEQIPNNIQIIPVDIIDNSCFDINIDNYSGIHTIEDLI